MQQRTKLAIGSNPIAVLLAAGGCTTYYQVTDAATQRTYFTTGIDKQGSGAVRFTDAKTGAEVTLQSSEVQKIDKGQYEASVGKK